MNFQGISIDSFRIFLAVSDQGSISKASELLFLDQSSVSRRIHQLESEVKAELFERSSRSVRLTTAGISLYDFAKNMLDNLSRLTEELSTARNDLSKLSIGTYDSIASNIYPNFFGKEINRLKQVRITNDTEKLIKAFNISELDALIVDTEFFEELTGSVYDVTLFSEPFYVVYGAKNKKAVLLENSLVTADVLSELELLLYPSTCPIHRKVVSSYADAARMPTIHQIEFAASSISFVLRTEMATILPESLAMSAVAKNAEGLKIRQLSSDFDRHLSLFSRSAETNEMLIAAGLTS